jgi:hypothetical protein
MNKSKLVKNSLPNALCATELPTDLVLSQVMELLAGVCERVQQGEPPQIYKSAGSVALWKDEAYAYIEAEVPAVNSDDEFDLCLAKGVVFVRIKLRDIEEPQIPIAKPLKRRRA